MKNSSVSEIYIKGEHTEGGVTAPVTEIAEKAFSLNGNQTIKKVVMHSNVTTIGAYAFMKCNALETVIAPGVTTFNTKDGNSFAFAYDDNLKTVIFKSPVGESISNEYQGFNTITQGLFLSNSTTATVDILVENTYHSIKTISGTNNQLWKNGGKIYYYNADFANAEHSCGNYWCYTDASRNHIKKGTAHSYVDGVCSECGAFDNKGINYNWNGSSYTVTALNDLSLSEVIVAAKYNDGMHGTHDVTAVGGLAFQQNSTITKVVLPEEVTTIGQRAFFNSSGNSKITTIIAPGVTTLGRRSDASSQTFNFYGLTALKEIVLASTVNVVNNAFNGCAANQISLCLNGATDAATIGETGNVAFAGTYLLAENAQAATAGQWYFTDATKTAITIVK